MGFWISLLLYAFTTVLSELLRPKPNIENAKPAGLGDFQFPTATEARHVPLLWGTVRTRGPNVVWYDDLLVEPIQEKIKTGLFSSETVTKGYEYSVGVQFLLCMGGEFPVDELRRVFVGEEEVFSGNVTDNTTFAISEPTLFGGDDVGGNGGVEGTLRFFAGSLTQAVSSYLAGFQLEGGDTPAYRGFCFVAPDAEPIYVGNSPSIQPWSFELRRTPNPLALTSSKHLVNSLDANPANVIYEALTDKSWGGFGFAASTIDTANFTTAGETLFDEGNGFSFLLDRPEEAGDLIRRIEQQIDGLVVFNETTQKWQLVLARGDYTPGTLPEINSTNIVRVESWTRGSWEGTTNEIRARFSDRADDYKETFAFAQDMANAEIQDGVRVSASETYGGVKDKTLANAIAWRDLRTLAYPLAQARIVTTRVFWDVQANDVLELTYDKLDVERLPMRVQRVDRGNIANGEIVLDLVQDVFYSAAGTFNDPQATGWTLPQDSLGAFPTDEQLVLEAPRAFTLRDPDNDSGPYIDKVWCAARKQGVEVVFDIYERNAAGTPSGSFDLAGTVYAFAKLGEINSTLAAGSAVPTTSILVTPTPDSQTAIESVFPDVTDLVEMGTELTTLIYVGDSSGGEFMLVTSAQTNASNVQLNNVYRGVLDSVQQEHASGTVVWVVGPVGTGAGISSETIVAGNNAHVKLLPRSISDALDEASATQVALTMSSRTRRPYPPSELSLNGTRFPSTTSLEGSGSDDDQGIGLTFLRRDFRTVDEVAALGVDATAIFADYPTANTTTHSSEVRNDPSGSNTLLFTEDHGSANSDTIRLLDILQATDGVVPSTMRLVLASSHTFESTVYASRDSLAWDFSVTSAFSGTFNFGALDTNDVSNSYTVTDDSVDQDFELYTAFTAGDVEYRINGGSWTTLIAASGTTGAIPSASVTNGDTVEIRHTSSDVGAQKLIRLLLSSTLTGHGVLFT